MRTKFFLPLLFIFSVFNLYSASLADNEGYPIVYLRGEITSPAWGADANYKFVREGNSYSLYVRRLEGKFKIADAEWRDFDYGGRQSENNIVSSQIVDLEERGANMAAENLQDVTFSFDVEKIDGRWQTKQMTVKCGDTPLMAKGLSGTLPVLYINVYTDESHKKYNDEIIDKDLRHKDYFSNATYRLDVSHCAWAEAGNFANIGSEEEMLPLEIKARGNYTRTGFSKKPFKIKLGKKQNLLGLTEKKSKHYALLAHADDNKGYLRNFVGFNLGCRIGLPWTPKQQPIELVINGDYRGLYFLTESVRVGDGRIEIAELPDNCSDASLVSGGYIVELDNYDEENQIRFKELPDANGDPWVRVTFDTPGIYSDLQCRFVSEQFNAINECIGSDISTVWSYLDLDDAARYYIVKEIISDTESFHGSTYLFRNRGENEKWHFSPLWDCGNAFNGNTSAFFYNCGAYGNTWIHTLAKEHKFRDCVANTWLWFMSQCYEGLQHDIDIYCERISQGAICDSRRWKDAKLPSSGNATPIADNSDIMRKKSEVISHLNDKTAWLRTQLGDYRAGVYPEPLRDTTPAAGLPDYVISGVAMPDIAVDAPEYFTLQGMRIKNPQRGEMYIRFQNGIYRKIKY